MLDAVCAGHICLDIVPAFDRMTTDWNEVFQPGRMTNVGKLHFSAGGSSANTGLAMNHFGIRTAIMAKVGEDHLGDLTASALEEHGASAEYLSRVKGVDSAYSIVLALPGSDRMFLHDPAANATFTGEDIDWDAVREARLFHLGYATLLRELYADDGRMLTDVLARAKEAGVTTSLDTAMPDWKSEGGRADWERIFASCLPYTDIFCPSVEELVLMTDPSEYYRLQSMNWDILQNLDMDQVSAIGARMIGMGAKIVVIKCGYLGCYVKTAPKSEFRNMGRGCPENLDAWAGREFFSAPYRVREVKSTIGAGGVMIGGFLTGVLEGESIERATSLALAAGASCVASFSAVDELMSIDEMRERIDSGWAKSSINYTGGRFTYDPQTCLYTG